MSEELPPEAAPPPPPNPRRQPALSAEPRLVRQLRKARRLTQLQLASAAGVSERTVRAAETGVRVRMDSLERLATALGAGLSDVIADPEELRGAHLANRNVDQLLRGFRAYFDDFDTSEFNLVFAPDAKIEIDGPPEIPFSGEYTGPEGLLTLAERCEEQFEYVQPSEIEEIRASGDLVILRGYDDLHSFTTGKRGRCAYQHVYEYERGRVVRVYETFDTLTAYRIFCEYKRNPKTRKDYSHGDG